MAALTLAPIIQRRPTRLPCALLLLLLAGFGGLLAFPAPVWSAPADVRVLIDVSGSMRQTDPRNLRVPGLRLFNELIPLGAQAGVWLFAEDVAVLNAPGSVDEPWKTRTRARLDRIHSRGLFTDIEAALTAASADWTADAPGLERHLLLMTDGVVDIAGGEEASAASRQRIVEEVVPRLLSLGVRIHVLALSDEVDRELLELIARRTDGWMEFITDADALQRVFLRLLEQTAPPTTVPLEGNRFEIDDSVSEFTLLAFRGTDGPIVLRTPADDTLTAAQPRGNRWRAEPGYDLVTVERPAIGTWQLEGSIDLDNRVAVLTDLGIDMTAVPSLVSLIEQIPIEAWLTEQGQPVTRRELLDLLVVTLGVAPVAAGAPGGAADAEAATPLIERPLTFDPESALFRERIAAGELPADTYQLQVMIDGGSFKRQLRTRVRVVDESPVAIDYSLETPGGAGSAPVILAQVKLDLDRVAPNSLLGFIERSGPDGAIAIRQLEGSDGDRLEIRLPVDQPGEQHLRARLQVASPAGKTLDLTLPEALLTAEFQPPKPSVSGMDDGAPLLSPLMLALLLGGGNLLLLLGAGLSWWALRRNGRSGTVTDE